MTSRILPAAERLSRFAMRQRGLASVTRRVRGFDLHIYDGPGEGALPPVVLIHGLGAGGGSFGPMVTALRREVRRVVVPELPGHGFSARPDEGARVTPEVVLDAVGDALDAMLDQPAVVFGNSLGGAVALGYALRSPARVKGLMLVSPAGAKLEDDEWKELLRAFDLRSTAEAKVFLSRVYHRPPWFLALFAHEFPDLLRRPAVREILESATPEHSPTPDALASLTMPILLLWGRSERLLPASALAWFRQHLPPQTVIEEPHGFGHAPQLEQPERLAERVLEFARGLSL